MNRVGWLDYSKPPINAFHWQMVDEVHQGLKQYLADREVRVIVLGSALDRFFSAGADITVFQGIGETGMRDWVNTAHEVARTLRQSHKPLLAAINGTAVGGGLEMTLHCDLRFAATDARLGQPEIALNLHPANRRHPGPGPTDRAAAGDPPALRWRIVIGPRGIRNRPG